MANTIYGTAGNDTLNGTSGDDVILGRDGNDVIYGNGADNLNGEGGNDQLFGGGVGNGLLGLKGGDGDDLLVAARYTSGQAHMWGDAGDDILELDVTKISSNDNVIHHGHHAYGGVGSDIFKFTNLDNATRHVVGRIDDFDASRDEIWVNGSAIDLTAPPSNVRIVMHQDQQWILIDNNILYGLEGARHDLNNVQEAHFIDWPNLSSLIDTTYVDTKNFVPHNVYSSVENSLNEIFKNSETIDGSQMADHIYAKRFGEKHQLIYGNDGDDVINANVGHDTVYGGNGKDSIAGGTDNDILYGNTGKDRLWGGTEDDSLYGGYHKDRLFGGSGNDKLFGQNGADRLYGGSGNDLLKGGNGNDTLEGGEGFDTFYGGAGDDDFIFDDSTAWRERVFDFSLSDDTVIFDGTNAQNVGDLAISNMTLSGTSGAIVNYGNGSLFLVGLTASSVNAQANDIFEFV